MVDAAFTCTLADQLVFAVSMASRQRAPVDDDDRLGEIRGDTRPIHGAPRWGSRAEIDSRTRSRPVRGRSAESGQQRPHLLGVRPRHRPPLSSARVEFLWTGGRSRGQNLATRIDLLIRVLSFFFPSGPPSAAVCSPPHSERHPDV